VKTLPGTNAAPDTGVFTARSAGKVARNAAWARFDRKFDPPLNLRHHQALGFWVEGDGLGELLAIRLDSPRHLAFGALADRYVPVDFTGRRYVTLIETESERWSDQVWNDGKWLYNAYRETIDFGSVESVTVWLNQLPSDKEIRCVIGPIKALPMLAGTVRHPRLTVNEQAITFPVEMPSGSFLELPDAAECTLYGAKGEVLSKVELPGAIPIMRPGANQVRFFCEPTDGPPPRLKVVLISHGDAF